MSGDLIRRFQNGDTAALCGIYEKYKDRLLTVAACPLGDVALAEDCLHDVFVSFAAGNGQLRRPRDLRRYLTACVANRARDELRRKSRRDVPLAGVDEIQDPRSGPTEQLLRQDEADQLYEALARLPYEQREVITLHLQGRMPFREIACHQGVSSNTVQSRYRYGLEKLRSLLKAGDE